MDKLTSMRIFTQVAELGSFTAAAERSHLSKAMVTKHVTQLEAHLGVRLLNRTTRRLSLTEAGRAYVERCGRILADIDETEQAVSHLAVTPRGVLRANAPVSFGLLHLAPALADYLARYPAVTVELTLNDRLVDVVEEGYDLAIRIDRFTDSSLVARRLAPARLVVCAAPAYFQRHGTPRQPADLAAHNCLNYSYWSLRDEWRFERAGQIETVRIRGSLQANNGDVLRAAALRGLGIILQPTFLVGEDIKTGHLQAILEDYRVPELTVAAVYPHRRYLSAKVRTFVDFLQTFFGAPPYWDRR